MKNAKRTLSIILALTLAVTLCVVPASAKTVSSARADNVFFYATNADGEVVLLKVIPLADLKKLAHGQDNGENYCISTTDNYPTTQYSEARGFTFMELVDYVKSVTTVQGAASVSFSGSDTVRLMATDSYGNYSRSWSWDELYGVDRYYFEGLYDSNTGWNIGWEIAGEDSSKYGVTLEDYNANYAEGDPYYADKRAVFDGGLPTTVILATESYSGRTTSETLVASTEPGIAGYISANSGKVSGSLKDVITDEFALRLSLPMTEADLMAAHRTAYDNFKWIYNVCLDMENSPAIQSQGAVAEPVPTFTLSGNILTVSLSCATAGARIYYGDDGAPQTLYTGPFTIDVTGRNLDSDPVTIYVTAVREGYTDAGVLSFQYPGMAPAFQTLYNSMAGEDLIFSAGSTVSSSDWNAWTNAINFITLKTPDVNGYVTVDSGNYKIDNAAKTITFDKSLFQTTGSYNFIFHATKYADKSTSVTVKAAAPTLTAAAGYPFGQPVTVTFDHESYQSGLSVYVTPAGGTRTMISTSYLDRTQAGQVAIKAEYFSAASTAMPRAGRYTLELVNNGYAPSSQTVEVTLTTNFSDVPADAWYAGAVDYVVGAGLFNGTSATTFAPNGTMNRAMFATVLHRLAGTPAANAAAPFTDVAAGQWYSDAVAWASEQGYVNGVGAGAFDPDGTITLEQMLTVLYRYSGSLAVSGNAGTAYGPVSDWANDAIAWAINVGLLNGVEDTLNAQGVASRVQVAAILRNMAETIS